MTSENNPDALFKESVDRTFGFYRQMLAVMENARDQERLNPLEAIAALAQLGAQICAQTNTTRPGAKLPETLYRETFDRSLESFRAKVKDSMI